jgi:hypothetical protein
LDTFSKQQARIDQLSTSIQSSPLCTQERSFSIPSYDTNAKYEEILCKPIKPPYDGSEDSLVPFLTKVDLHHQNEGWEPATFITIDHHTYDLTCNFTNVNETEVTNAAISRVGLQPIKHKAAYAIRLFATLQCVVVQFIHTGDIRAPPVL